MKNILILTLSLLVVSGCNASSDLNTQKTSADEQVVAKVPTQSVSCYSGTMVTYSNDNIILDHEIWDKDISATFTELETNTKRVVPISQCYFKYN